MYERIGSRAPFGEPTDDESRREEGIGSDESW